MPCTVSFVYCSLILSSLIFIWNWMDIFTENSGLKEKYKEKVIFYTLAHRTITWWQQYNSKPKSWSQKHKTKSTKLKEKRILRRNNKKN